MPYFSSEPVDLILSLLFGPVGFRSLRGASADLRGTLEAPASCEKEGKRIHNPIISEVTRLKYAERVMIQKLLEDRIRTQEVRGQHPIPL